MIVLRSYMLGVWCNVFHCSPETYLIVVLFLSYLYRISDRALAKFFEGKAP